jgi:small subunit ribosomal protein S20
MTACLQFVQSAGHSDYFWRKQVANIKSQIKRNRQNDKRRLRNRVYRGTARIAVKNARTAIDSGVPESKAALINAISALDKAAEQGVIHRNNAARRKSRLVKAFAKMEPVQVAAEPAMLEPIAEAGSASSPKGAKAAPRRRAAKAAPAPEAETAQVPAKKATTKKAATKKAPAKKASTAAKKPAAKKIA